MKLGNILARDPFSDRGAKTGENKSYDKGVYNAGYCPDRMQGDKLGEAAKQKKHHQCETRAFNVPGKFQDYIQGIRKYINNKQGTHL